MIGIIIVTHSQLAEELRLAAEMILGPLEKVETVHIERSTSVEAARKGIAEGIEKVNPDGDGVVILTDLFGGTATNISVEFLCRHRVEVLTGVNLPMLLKCAGSRLCLPLEELVILLRDHAKESIIRPFDLLS